MILQKAGDPRIATETKEDLELQIDMATRGVLKPIAESQTESGVKDKVCNVLIENTLAAFQDEKRRKDGRSTDQISEALTQNIATMKIGFMNPLLTMPGDY